MAVLVDLTGQRSSRSCIKIRTVMLGLLLSKEGKA